MHHIPNKFRLCVQNLRFWRFWPLKRSNFQCHFLFFFEKSMSFSLTYKWNYCMIQLEIVHKSNTYRRGSYISIYETTWCAPIRHTKNFINFEFFRMTQKFLTICAFWMHILKSLFLRNIYEVYMSNILKYY